MKAVRITVISLIVLILASGAMAYPTLNEILSGAPAIDPSGFNYATLLNPDENTVATLLLEMADYADENVFGIYNPDDISEKLELFSGGNTPTDSVEVEFNLVTGIAKNLTTNETAIIGATFGFYLISPDEGGVTFYTDETLNPGGYDQGLLYDTSAYSGVITGDPDTVVAFEDIVNLGDEDWNDMVVGITNAVPTPEPCTIVLLGLGTLVAIRKKRI